MTGDRDENLVVFLPDKRQFNPYQTRLAEALGAEGFRVIVEDHPPLLGAFSSLQRKYKSDVIIHLHWLNGLIDQPVHATNGVKFSIWYLLVAIDLALFRARGGKLFWTVHNIIGHECPNPAREKKMRRLIATFAHGMHFHSQSAVGLVEKEYRKKLQPKAIIAAHASYAEDYLPDAARADTLATSLDLRDDNFTFLFFGNIRRYKGLDLLLEAFRTLQGSHYRLLIAGGPVPGLSVEWLEEAAQQDSRLRLRVGFIPDADVAAIFAISDALVAPYAKTLTSGVVSLGLTFGLPMVLPEAAKVYDIPGVQGAEYFSEGELSQALQSIEQRDLPTMRAHNRQIGQGLTWQRMAEQLAQAYRSASPGQAPGSPG